MHERAEWQTAVRILIAAAEGHDFIMHARVAMMRAIGARPEQDKLRS